jgi:hypothetical protein
MGKFLVFTIPDNFDDLYGLPVQVLNRIKEIFWDGLFARLEAPARVSLFLYDNDTLIIESFLDEKVTVHLVLRNCFLHLQELLKENYLSEDEPGKSRFTLTLQPHSFRAFRVRKA